MRKEKSKVERISISIERELLEKFDELIKNKDYTNRSEAIRDLIREALIEDKLEKNIGEVFACIVIVYDHEVRGIEEKLTDLQHEYKNIISSMHVHLDKRNCMETLVVRGKANEIKKMADRIISAKGVKHGRVVFSGAE